MKLAGMNINDHPVLAGAGAGLTILSIVTTLAFTVWFMLDLREKLDDTLQRGVDIRHEQEEIRKELALQTITLQTIRQEQKTITDGQKWIVSEINNGLGEFAINMGRLLERTENDE